MQESKYTGHILNIKYCMHTIMFVYHKNGGGKKTEQSSGNKYCAIITPIAQYMASACVNTTILSGRSGLVVTRLPAAREDPGSRRAVGKSLCFHENHCDTQLWARAAH